MRSDDLTTRARLRDAALRRFGRDGFAASGVRAIAADAGVSPALVLHHFGSKAGLRRECDAFVARTIREYQTQVAEDPMAGVTSWLDKVQAFEPLRDYLARALTDADDLAVALLHELAADAETYLARWEEHGLVRAAPDGISATDRALYLTATSLGLLVLRPLVARHLGRPDGPGVDQHLGRPALDIYTHGLFADPSVVAAMTAQLEER